jgi:hypothetical protein
VVDRCGKPMGFPWNMIYTHGGETMGNPTFRVYWRVNPIPIMGII